jgi:hypothetical protein
MCSQVSKRSTVNEQVDSVIDDIAGRLRPAEGYFRQAHWHSQKSFTDVEDDANMGIVFRMLRTRSSFCNQSHIKQQEETEAVC